MPTPREIIQDALTEINVLADGETMDASMAQLGLLRLQKLIEAWQADRLSIAVSPRVAFTLPSGTSTMTIGSGGDIDAARPDSIDRLNYIVPASTPSVEVPLGKMTDQAYQGLSIKSLTSSLPTLYYFTRTVPLSTLFFWPTVTQDVSMALYYPTGVQVPTTLDSTLVGPTGFREAILYALAKRLCRPFAKQITQDLLDDARESFAVMARPNNNPGVLSVDQALMPYGGPGYNIYSDTNSGGNSR
jgi:hypothetical protein